MKAKFTLQIVFLALVVSIFSWNRGWGQCPYSPDVTGTGTATCPLDLVQIVGMEPDVDGLLFTQVWTTSTTAATCCGGATQNSYLIPFSLMDINGNPRHVNGPTTEILKWPSVGVSYDTNGVSGSNSIQYIWPTEQNTPMNSHEQVQQDGWLLIPDDVQCIRFRFPSGYDRSAALYISDVSTVSTMTLRLSVTGGAAGTANWNVPGTVAQFGGAAGFRYTRFRVYLHDGIGRMAGELEWDIGDGFVKIPRSYFQSVNAAMTNSNPPTLVKEASCTFAYRDSLGLLFYRDSQHNVGGEIKLDARFKEDSIPVIADVSGNAYCIPGWSCNNPSVVQIERLEPDAGGIVHQLEWNSVYSNTPQLDYLDAFDTLYLATNLPDHRIAPTGVSASALSNSLGVQGTTGIHQSIRDAWIAVPSTIQCIQFKLGGISTEMQASALWVGRNFNSLRYVADEVNGIQTGGAFRIPTNAHGAATGWVWLRARLYTDNQVGGYDSRVQWDLGDGMELIPDQYIRGANSATQNGSPGNNLSFTTVSRQFALSNSLPTFWVPNGPNTPSVPIWPSDILDQGFDTTHLNNCTNIPPPIPANGATCMDAITAHPCNNIPDAVNDIAYTTQGAMITIKPLMNDTGSDPGDILTLDSIQYTGTNAAVIILAADSLFYDPIPAFRGIDTIKYFISDNGFPILTDSAMVIVLVDADSDGDLVLDPLDLDNDNDGISNADEMLTALNGGDTDGDMVDDTLDLDSDNDGIPDILEWGGTDPDGDGMVPLNGSVLVDDTNGNGWDDNAEFNLIPMANSDLDSINSFQDLDSDNDGIYDIVEAGGVDTDSNGIVDMFMDGDGDGWDDVIRLGEVYLDGDGIPERLDLDSDNDGIPNLVEEGQQDTLGDGMIDNFVDVNPQDGASDSLMTAGTKNNDNDPIPNYLDLDSDNDGIPDLVEDSGSDPGSIGVVATNITDTNGDGWDDVLFQTGREDADSDSLPNYLDLDSDNDGIYDILEAGGDTAIYGQVLNFLDPSGWGWDLDERNSNPLDSDYDGYYDQLDRDSDNDGIPDIMEAGGDDGLVSDGMLDTVQDTNQNGADDGRMIPIPFNHDPDLIWDFRDPDSDNDGIFDIVEAGGVDANNDARADDTLDADFDGWRELAKLDLSVNFDLDIVPDIWDLDSDNDGIFDLSEAFAAIISLPLDTLLFDGHIDDLSLPGSVGWDSAVAAHGYVDTDTDGLRDNTDLDSDNDGIADLFEDQNWPSNLVGTLDPITDGNANGADDSRMASVRADADAGTEPILLPNFRDLDSDQDGIADMVEAGYIDSDSNGIFILSAANDTNGNGWVDQNIPATPDLDQDNIYNYLDLDSDNDGVPDIVEDGGLDPTDSGVVALMIVDPDSNGWDNNFPLTGTWDADSDLVPNYLDLDSDNDGIYDILEAGGLATAGGIVSNFADSTGHGWDFDERIHDTEDSDFDGYADLVDLDSDNDGIPDILEAGGDDGTVSDGMIDGVQDNDGNGADDSLMRPEPYNHDPDSIRDFRDPDSDNDGIPDLVEAGGPDINYDARVDDITDVMPADGWRENGKLDLSVSTDADSIPDLWDLDSDNDGIYDIGEAFPVIIAQIQDTNFNGRLDSLGLPGTVGWDSAVAGLGIFDTDGDGLFDQLDVDSDNDGLADIFEDRYWPSNLVGSMDPITDADTNGADDGRMQAVRGDADLGTEPVETPNFRDLDSDNDGIPDKGEAGWPDNLNPGFFPYSAANDINGDGWIDQVLLATHDLDHDQDSVFNFLDLDSDNDGIPDVVEDGGIDASNLGVVAVTIADTNEDGWDDVLFQTGTAQADQDSLPNYLDLDSDNDGIYDILEAGGRASVDGRVGNFADSSGQGWDLDERIDMLPDTDSDLFHDFRDLDSDNDGIPDILEAGGDDGANPDGMIDAFVFGDPDGAHDSLMQVLPDNHDFDTIPDFRDFDSDNDGITDITEAGGVDLVLFDGQVDDPTDTSPPDGWRDNGQLNGLKNSDADAVPDRWDLDSDNDGIYDMGEALPLTVAIDQDINFDGRLDSLVLPGSIGWDPFAAAAGYIDTDQDSIYDFQDLDSDNDGLSDIFEDRTWPTNGIGALDTSLVNDTNGTATGMMQRLRRDADFGSEALPAIPNFRDLDSDQDGIPDMWESGYTYSDSAGKFTLLPAIDSDGNGWIDFRLDTIPDQDADGYFNFLDLDSDNDGIADLVEDHRVDMPDTNGIVAPTIIDTGIRDGWDDNSNRHRIMDSDLDNVSDFTDLDSDNDGLFDILEGGGLNSTNGMVIIFSDSAMNGWSTEERIHVPNDTDEDDFANYVDLDSDQDGIPDIVEAGGSDGDTLDGRINLPIGSLINGAYSAEMVFNPDDRDFDLIPNYLDRDSDNDGLTDVLEVGGDDSDGDGEAGVTNSVIVDGWIVGAHQTGRQNSDSIADNFPDHLDLDSDNDGIYDLAEGFPLSEVETMDADSNGRADTLELAGTAGWKSGLTTLDLIDSDGDGINDFQDSDSDNDGLADIFEDRDWSSNLIGSFVAFQDSFFPDGADDFKMKWKRRDTDQDSVPDFRDLDSDQDGIADDYEFGYLDRVYDGKTDTLLDMDGDGWIDEPRALAVSKDGDDYPNHLDRDSDNDGIPDIIEGSGVYPQLGGGYDSLPYANYGADGWIDFPIPQFPLDTDKDGKPDFLDFDSDGDGILDVIESALDKKDENNDSIVDGWDDIDGFGWFISEGVLNPSNVDLEDEILSQSEILPDYRDLDSDNDSVPDEIENGFNYDNGGCSSGDLPLWRDPYLCDVEIYEGFSPNGDGINEELYINGIEYHERDFTFTVFNRWGAVIYKIEEREHPWIWDGRCNTGLNCSRQIVPPGVYFYTLDMDNRSRFQKGYVYVLK